ncbi:MAG: PAS domain-containing protein, partial [Anaerolineales bacterium]|nr:PAS domain-containing protein [Anaerolineales bacterium]
TLPALVEKAVRNYQAIQAARHSLERVHYQAMLLDNVRDAIVVWNTAGNITYWSRSAEALFGRSAVECLGQKMASVYGSGFDPTVRSPESGGAQADVERRYRMPGQERTIWVSSTVTAFADADGRISGYMDVCREITQRKQLETQFKVAQTQLAEATRLAAIGELASGVAHQISNPLTTIIAEAQLLLHQLSPKDENRDSAKAIEQAGWRAQRTIQRLLDFAKPAHGLDDDVSVNATIEHAIHLIGGHIESLGGVALSTELALVPPVRGSQRQLEDLWVNLLLMARDATADGRPHQIYVRSRLTGAEVQVEVNDNGALIPPSKLGSIFEPDFEGFDNGRGSGLELSLCREIVRQHRGRISVNSEAENGTTFTILLPTEGTHNGTR